MKRTKGRWTVRDYIGKTKESPIFMPVYYMNVCTAKAPGGRIIAKCLGKDKIELKANAKLIAAAPEQNANLVATAIILESLVRNIQDGVYEKADELILKLEDIINAHKIIIKKADC